jgi:hypothetical protein
LHAAVQRIFVDQVPVEAPFLAPFPPLAEFAAHEEQFFAWMGPLVAVEQRKLANFCHISPGILSTMLFFKCTTSSCEKGRANFSLKA